MDTPINLGGVIELSGFSSLDSGTMAVLKKIIGNYTRKLIDRTEGFEKVSMHLKKLKSGEERNKLDISVIMNDVERKYESLSGGEKRRVDVAVCLALNEWAGRKYSNQDGFLGLAILDEVFSYIDRAGEETIASFLYNLGFTRTVLVISHTPELASYGYRVWNVIKENGVSELQTNE